MSFEPGGEGERRRREEIDFFDELKRLATAEDFRRFVVILMSGTEIVVELQSTFNIYKSMYSVDSADGTSEMFPRYNVCAVRILPEL